MRSFNDIHDSDDVGQASRFNNAVYTPSNQLERTTLLLPIELKYNPILSLPSTIDPTLLRSSAAADESAHFSACLRLPLLLADAGKQAGGPSDFQSNGVLPYDSQGRVPDLFSRKSNGLGLLLGDDRKDSKTPTITQHIKRSPTPTSPEGVFCSFTDSPPAYLTTQDPFDDCGNIKVSFGGLMQSSNFSDRKASNAAVLQSSGLSLWTFKTLGEDDLSHDSELSSASEMFGSSTPIRGPSNFTGLVADINMFDKGENDTSICVRPQDLMRDTAIAIQEAQEPGSPTSTMILDTTDDFIGSSNSPPATPRYLQAPQSNWPQIPTEHLPFLVERYLAHFEHKASSEEGQDMKHDTPSAFQSGDPSAYPYTPITAEILEAVEEPLPAEVRAKYRKKLADKTNISRPGLGSRAVTNVLNMCDLLIPQDVSLERAYEGVSVVAVAQKTKYFIMMHPGERLSEDLLFSFAGRLSASGQTMSGYRCYVEGCSKTTKRKDHMGDHVRTHLGEKPFQCSVCGMGFIRNNDCQRHENNHRPDKKFVCTCKAAFSRRDLFVRHQKTACTRVTITSGCSRRPQKHSKAPSFGRRGSPDGDDANDFDYVPSDATWATVCA